ncbi:MAG: glutamine amidotransferase class-II [Peptococcaceae bacterium]|jgi:glutamate synthase domain-containing protein 1|nr:glutamine amidotransferase class-II [Peptococcaceae bacterium]
MLREGVVRIPSGCAISGMMNKKGKCFSGEDIIKSIAIMHDRSNGLGGGFAGYGIYPDFKDDYAFHFFFDDDTVKETVETLLNKQFTIIFDEPVPTRKTKAIKDAPIIWRYFVQPKSKMVIQSGIPEEEYVVKFVMKVNSEIEGAYIFSSGKNMGAFKGVGYPEDIGDFFRLDEYKGYIWTAHGRFPTNTPGWWGGAHPFTLLDISVVHNGEISSYGTNRRFLEMYGYKCTLQTDTEVMAYIFDYLMRRQGLSLDVVVAAMASPLWMEINRMDPEKRELVKAIRAVYGSLLVNGPFSILVGTNQGMIALNDRIKLRPSVAATKGDFLYVASEESAIREICPKPDKVWAPRGGEPVIGLLENAQVNYNFAAGENERIAINS